MPTRSRYISHMQTVEARLLPVGQEISAMTSVWRQTQAQEAINMRAMIKQLGVTVGNIEEDQQSRILEKIRSMEDRDRIEAERLGVMINDP